MMRVVDRVMVALSTGFVAVGVGTLALAVAGIARPVLVVPVVSALWGALLWAWGTSPAFADPAAAGAGDRTSSSAGWTHRVVLVLGAAAILASTAHNLRHQGEYVVTDRDSGIYVVGGKWIADHGKLVVDSGVGNDVLAVDGVVVSGGGQTETDEPGRLQIQGAHLFHVVLAVGEWVGSSTGSAAVPAVVGGLALTALFWLALRVVPDWAALFVVVAMAVDFAWLYTVRAALSEPTLLLISAAGAALLIDATASWPDRPLRLTVAGFVAATALTARIDSGAVLLAFPLLVAWVVRRQGPGSRPLRALAWWGGGAVFPLVLAVVDLTVRSPRYLTDLRSEVSRVVAAVIAAVVVAVLVAASGSDRWRERIDPVAARVRPWVPRLAVGAAAVVLALAAFAWFVRPELGPDRRHRGGQGWRLMEAIQVHEGLEPDGRRTYAERSLDRIRWYAGPMAIAAGAAGLAVLAWRLVADRIRPAELVAAGLVVPYLVMYLYLPSVDADHPWFIRRYVPTAIPGLLLFAAVAAAALAAGKRWSPCIGRVGAAAIAVGCVAWPLHASWPLRAVSWQAGGRDGVVELCRELAPGSVAVLAADDRVGLTLLPAVRSYCDVEAVAIAPDRTGTAGRPVVDAVVDVVAARTEPAPVDVVASSPEVLRTLAPHARDVREVAVLRTTQVGTTIGQRPGHIGDRRLVVWIGTIHAPVA